MLKDMDFYHLLENIYKKILDTGLHALKTASKKVVHKTGRFLGNKIADAVTKSNGHNVVKQEPVKEIIIRPEEKDEILKELRQIFL